MPRVKGIILYSGGLDSLLAARVLMDQDIELVGFHGVLPFVAPDFNLEKLKASELARQIGLKLHYYRCGEDYLQMVKNPPHGYGKHFNPCIDCKIFLMRRAGELMQELNADFVATGEVIGQRPMSQLKNSMRLIEKESGLQGFLLRPLSAKLLKPTIPEAQGLIDREKLLDISGRGRRRQMELADYYEIKEYSSPAGGCLFAEPHISLRIKDYFQHDFSGSPVEDFYLITLGRYFRISDSAVIIVGRNKNENFELEKYKESADYFFIPEFAGPNVFVRGFLNEKEIAVVSSIICFYGKPNDIEKDTLFNKRNSSVIKLPGQRPIEESELIRMRI